MRHDVEAEGRLPLASLLLRKPGSRTLVAYLHGSLDRPKYSLPRFERLESLQDLDANILFLSDPTLHLHEGLRLAWFIGTADDDATEHARDLIRHVSEQLDIKQLIICGGSSGGYASIALAPHFPDALAIAWSPQTNVRRYGKVWAEWLRRTAFPEFETFADIEADPGLKPRLDLEELYRRAPGGRVWYVQNTGDESHIRQFSLPFEASLDGQDRVTFVYEHHCIGHNPPAPTRVRSWLQWAISNHGADPRTFALPLPQGVPDFRYESSAAPDPSKG